MADEENSTETPTSMVTLKNGYETQRVAVGVTFLSVEVLMHKDFLAFYELVSACRHPSHPVFIGMEKILLDLALVDEVDAATRRARIHEHTRNVVLSMVEGDGMGLYLVNPIVT